MTARRNQTLICSSVDDPVVFKNSISLKLLVEGWGHFRVLRSADARDFRPIFVRCDLDRRLDESASAACDRLSHRGESGSSRTDWHPPFEIQRQSAPSISGPCEKAHPKATGASGQHRHSRDSVGMAPKIDRAEI